MHFGETIDNTSPYASTRDLFPLLNIFSISKNILNLQIFRDLRVILDWYRNDAKLQVLLLDYYKFRIIELQNSFHSLTFHHIYCQFNDKMDNLSKTDIREGEGILFTR